MRTHKTVFASLFLAALSAFLLTPALGQQPDKPGKPDAGQKKTSGGVFARLDKNNDGFITQDEAPAKRWQRLTRFDANKDSKLSKDELAKGRGKLGGGPGVGRSFERLDKNNDGFITQDEAPAKLWQHISPLDKNKDGKISKEESAGMKSGKGKRPARPGNDAPNPPKP